MSRVDAHHHVWDLSVRDQAWLAGEPFAPIRLALSGSKVSPGLFESLELLGREESVRRLRAVDAAAV